MKSSDYDVIILGAGASGLAAMRELDRAGRRTLCLEARDRIGGRVYTLHEPLSPMPIELGAEFVHGQPPEIWEMIRSHGLLAYDCADRAVHIRDGKVLGVDGWELVDRVVDDMRKTAKKGKDRSFSEFVAGSAHSGQAKQLATSYVEGFNAARSEKVSIASLAEDAEASDQIDGDHTYRLISGYDAIIRGLIAGVNDLPSKLHLNSIVRRIEWSAGQATVHVESAVTGQTTTAKARRVIVTAPLGVLQGDIEFDPEPANVEAARKLEFGQVMRVAMRFRKAFWEENQELARAGFLLSDEKYFPTWWVLQPVRVPVIIGWSAGPHADGLLGRSKSEIVERALHDLARITAVRENELERMLEAAYFHDWHADPFARGAYSYVPVGEMSAREAMAKPVEDTLYFAGEATDTEGHSATVHGAIATGRRAAQQILNAAD